MTKTDVPVVIEEEAARRIPRLQIQKEMELMIGWVRDNVPYLRGIRIVGHEDAPSRPDRILMWAHEAGPPWESVPESPDYQFITWRFDTFPPEVGMKVSMWSTRLPMPLSPCDGEMVGAVAR